MKFGDNWRRATIPMSSLPQGWGATDSGPSLGIGFPSSDHFIFVNLEEIIFLQESALQAASPAASATLHCCSNSVQSFVFLWVLNFIFFQSSFHNISSLAWDLFLNQPQYFCSEVACYSSEWVAFLLHDFYVHQRHISNWVDKILVQKWWILKCG